MSKELQAFRKICKNLNSYEFTDEYKKNKKLIETTLKDYEKQDNIISIIKETIEFNIQEPEIEVKENGEISLLSRVGMGLRKQLNEKEKELFREWVLKECFPEELKALEIIKEKGIILQFIKETYTVEQYNAGVFGTLVKPLTKEEYDLLKKVLLCKQF